MVKHSLRKLLDKYPYFLDKRRISNLYKVTKVNNSVFKDLYNSIFHTYQSFHLNKRLLTWKTQTQPYAYKTHFCCSYPNIKTVQIYKNDILIHQEEFNEEDNKTDFCWTYDCSYVKTNMLPVKVYRCMSCDNIYFGDELPVDCVGENCNSNTYIQTKIFKCNTCGEYYFADTINDLEDNGGLVGDYTVVNGYKCTVCGELFEEIPSNCKNNCNSTSFEPVQLYKCKTCGDLHEEAPVVEGEDKYIEVYAFRCMGNHESEINEYESEMEGFGRELVNIDCGELYIGVEPPEVCNICGASGIAETKDLYYNDETLMVIDNSNDYEPVKQIEMSNDIQLNHIDDSLLVNTDKKLFVEVVDSANNLLKNTTVRLYNYQHYVELQTNENGLVQFPLDISKKYTQVTISKEGYVSRNGQSVSTFNIPWDYIASNYILTVKLYNIRVYQKLNTYEEESDFNLRTTELLNIDGTGEILRVPFPIIPDDRFLFHVETWDEYWVDKGYPENDEYMGDEYDHDYSLDMIGKLNNIPRKRYVDVDDNNLYYNTEPPFNKCLSEDDYHYMNRMLEYNIRLWVSLIKEEDLGEYYNQYIEILNSIGISEEDYLMYLNNSRLFKQKYNPVTLEMWKNYSVPSTLINRERNILKLVDIRKHNENYLPYNVDSDGNPIKIYKKWELDKEGNPLNKSVGRLSYKDKWKVETDLLDENWVPAQWEHKDKFCDGSILYKTNFFVIPETLRPLPYETVFCDFKLMNSIAEPVDIDYHVVLEYYRGTEENIKPVNDRIITENHCYIKYTMFSMSKPTVIRFKAYETDYTSSNIYRCEEDNFIGSVDIVFHPRNSCNADIYVDVNSEEDEEDGSNEYPYKSLQTALNKVNRNKDLICLKSDVDISEPLFVPNTCRILGNRQRDVNCTIEKGVNNVPIIRNDTNKRFFKLIGTKNCNLKLVDLRLAHGVLNSYIGLGTWENNNYRLDDYEYVVIHGGYVNLVVNVDKESYYPTDIVKVNIQLLDKVGNYVVGQKVELCFDNGEKIIVEDTDNDGVIEYNLHINKLQQGIYDLVATLKSDLYFNSSVVKKINCMKEPVKYNTNGGDISLHIPVDPCGTYNLCVDGEFLASVSDDDCDGYIDYVFRMTKWGTSVLTLVEPFEDEVPCEGDVVYEVIIEMIVTLSNLVDCTFIKNFNIALNGDVVYDTVKVTENSNLGELNGILLDIKLSGTRVETEIFTVKNSRLNATDILASEGTELKRAITNLTYNESDSEIKFTRMGEFW